MRQGRDEQMSYRESTALDAMYAEREEARRSQQARPSFEVVQGGGLDRRVRQGVSEDFLAWVKLAVAVAVLVVSLGIVRVSLTTATVSMLQGNSALESSIEDAQTENQNLKVERSVLSSGSRISRIATQNYGMVLTSSKEVVDVTPEGQASEGADAEATADGDAAQSAGDTSATADEA